MLKCNRPCFVFLFAGRFYVYGRADAAARGVVFSLELLSKPPHRKTATIYTDIMNFSHSAAMSQIRKGMN